MIEFNDKITKAFDGCEVIIDRVGLVSELMSIDNLHNILNEFVYIQLDIRDSESVFTPEIRGICLNNFLVFTVKNQHAVA